MRRIVALVVAVVLVAVIVGSWPSRRRANEPAESIEWASRQARRSYATPSAPKPAASPAPIQVEREEPPTSAAGAAAGERRETACEGRLVYDDGAPVANEPVWLDTKERPRAETDADGVYRLVSGEYAPYASLELGSSDSHRNVGLVSMRLGETTHDEFVVPRGVSLNVEVIDAERGEPIPDATVTIASPDYAGQSTGRTSADGRVALEHVRCAPGELLVVVDGWQDHRCSVDLSGGAILPEIRASLLPAPRLRIRAVGLPGGISREFALSLEHASFYTELRGTLGDDDAVIVNVRRPGRCRALFHVWNREFDVDDVEVPERGTVDLVVDVPEHGVLVHGRLLGSGGASIGALTVRLVAGRLVEEAAVRTTGEFEFASVPPGVYEWKLLRDYGFELRGFAPGLEVGQADVEDIELVLPSGEIHGRVVPPDDCPLPYCGDVRLEQWNGAEWIERGSSSVDWLEVTQCDSAPEYRFDAWHLAPGRWRVALVGCSPEEPRAQSGPAVELVVDTGSIDGVELTIGDP
jgi:hypothetical protein